MKDRWGQEGDQFRFPYPLSEDEFLPASRPALTHTGLWSLPGLPFVESLRLVLMNADGERELLWRAPDLGVHRMV